MLNRRGAIKIILVLITSIVSYLLFSKWLQMISPPNLSFLRKKKSLIAELAEVIIPKTDTPGAKDAKVEEFIIKMIQYCSDAKTQNNFLHGLKKVETYTIDNYHRPFVSCSNSEKVAILNHFENDSKYKYNILNKINYKFLGKPFIIKFKELTVEGYCTSEPGATKGLAYDFIPANFEACIPLRTNQVAWATK